MNPEDFRKLVAAGLTTEQIAIVMEMMERDAKAVAEAEENRKAKGRERMAKWRLERHRNVTVTQPIVTEQLTGASAPAEDKLLPTDIEPQTKEDKSAPAPPTPRQNLELVLDAERAGAVIEHRKRMKSPLTAHAAKLLAKEFAKCPDPNLAADRMVKDGWRGFEAQWMDRPQARAGPRGRQAPMDHFTNYASEINGQERDDRGPGGDWDDAPGVPVRAIEHHG